MVPYQYLWHSITCGNRPKAFLNLKNPIQTLNKAINFQMTSHRNNTAPQSQLRHQGFMDQDRLVQDQAVRSGPRTRKCGYLRPRPKIKKVLDKVGLVDRRIWQFVNPCQTRLTMNAGTTVTLICTEQIFKYLWWSIRK